jgi:hypothetical protein
MMELTVEPVEAIVGGGRAERGPIDNRGIG